MRIIPRQESGLPIYPASHYPGPFLKTGVAVHHMGAHENGIVSIERAKQITRVNYDHQLRTWAGSIDILEGYDLYQTADGPLAIECRPAWSNCDAFSGMAELDYQFVGVEVCGNWHTQPVPEMLIRGMAELIEMLWRQGKVAAGWPAIMLSVMGHRDFNHLSRYGPSECPGDYLYERIPEIKGRFTLAAERNQEEEDMSKPLRLIENRNGTFVYAIEGLVQPNEKLSAFAINPKGTDIPVTVIAISPWGDLIAPRSWGLGGINNRDKVHGMDIAIEGLFPNLPGGVFIELHAPADKIYGGVS
ncbi:MAG: peptidoglycan recognition protein family protein [Candidatus Geothermincolia bacterium]